MNAISFSANAVWVRRIFAGVTMVVFAAIVGLALGVGAVRTFLVDATVRGLDITFEGQTNFWDLGPVTLCVPLDKLNLRAARGDGACDARRYSEQRDDVSIEWADGASVIVERSGATNFSLTVVGQSTLADRTRIIVAQDNWSMIGTLSFVGNAVLGRPAGSGETRLLLGADYQVREKPFGSGHTETIKSGTVRKGESVSLIQRGNGAATLATVYGYITPSSDSPDALDIGIVSQAGEIAMSVRFFGGDTPAQIAPNWIDRTLSSPLVLALAFLLSVGLGAAQLFMGIRPFRATPAVQKASAHQAQLRNLTRYSGKRTR
jgi:hypothetical protein